MSRQGCRGTAGSLSRTRVFRHRAAVGRVAAFTMTSSAGAELSVTAAAINNSRCGVRILYTGGRWRGLLNRPTSMAVGPWLSASARVETRECTVPLTRTVTALPPRRWCQLPWVGPYSSFAGGRSIHHRRRPPSAGLTVAIALTVPVGCPPADTTTCGAGTTLNDVGECIPDAERCLDLETSVAGGCVALTDLCAEGEVLVDGEVHSA